MGKKKQSTALGKSIIRDRFGKTTRTVGDNFLHTADLQDGYDWGRLNLQSVTEQNNLDDFLTTAELAGTEFTAEKLNVKFISHDTGSLPHADELKTIRGLHKEHEQLLTIPRRPAWSTQMSATEVDQNEKSTFLDWRRTLSSVQEDERIVMTPYEKNLDFWRQLWRVIERSDIVVQIVDARNPLLFYCSDLESYVKEVNSNKICMVLINKADFLNQQQRATWSDYFTARGIKVAFWSAVDETARQEHEAKLCNMKECLDLESGDTSGDDDSNVSDIDPDSVAPHGNTGSAAPKNTETLNILAADVRKKLDCNTKLDIEQTIETKIVKFTEHSETETAVENVGACSTNIVCSCDTMDTCDGGNEADDVCSVHRDVVTQVALQNTSQIHTGPELLELFKSLSTTMKDHEGLTTVGMVGYPNVGKSSTINAILNMKKVPVSATPGRTKHFQTLYVDPTLMLCDCPGLVFPSFVTTKADLVTGGILPIDQMRDYISPTALLCQTIPRWLLEITYGINLPKPLEGEDPTRQPTAHELLNTYGAMRGFMTNRGQPDEPRSSRYLLKDYVNGKLLYCHPPPEVEPIKFNGFDTREPVCSSARLSMGEAGNKDAHSLIGPSQIDTDFFRKDFPSLHNRTSHSQQMASSSSSSLTSLNDKPSKKHNNKKKREKLRRVYGYLDQ